MEHFDRVLPLFDGKIAAHVKDSNSHWTLCEDHEKPKKDDKDSMAMDT